MSYFMNNELSGLFPSVNLLITKEFDRLEHLARTRDLRMEDYETLYFLLGHDKLEKAFHIIDNKCVKLIETSNFINDSKNNNIEISICQNRKLNNIKRSFFTVDASKNTQIPYNVFLNSSYCSCEAYLRSTYPQLRPNYTIKKDQLKNNPLCKHIIAAKIAFITKKYKKVIITQEKFALKMCNDMFD